MKSEAKAGEGRGGDMVERILRAKFLGTTDDVTTCDCCGRKNLKSTVALEIDDAEEPVYYGVTCAAHALKLSVKEVRNAARTADDARYKAEQAAKAAAHRAEYDRLQAFLDTRYPQLRGDRFRQLEAIGGLVAAYEAAGMNRAGSA